MPQMLWYIFFSVISLEAHLESIIQPANEDETGGAESLGIHPVEVRCFFYYYLSLELVTLNEIHLKFRKLPFLSKQMMVEFPLQSVGHVG